MPEGDLVVAALLTLIASIGAHTAPALAVPVRGETPRHTCRTAGTDAFIGRTATSRVGSAILHVSRAEVLRWAPPGAMLTMDFRRDRVNVYLDGRKSITKISCG